METKTYTTETKIKPTEEFVNYYEPFLNEESAVLRRIYRIMTTPDFRMKYPRDSDLLKVICGEYCYMKRTVNSMIRDVKGRLNSLLELKKTQLFEVQTKIKKTYAQIIGYENTINKLKPKVTANEATEQELNQYRKAKKALYPKQQKLNRLKNKEKKLKYEIDYRVLKIGFGGKQMFKKQYHLAENGYKTHAQWYRDYVKARDKNILYLGSHEETCGNQMFQMTYNEESNDFTLKIRKEMMYYSEKEPAYIIIEHIDFKYLKNEIIACLKQNQKKDITKKKPLTYRVRRLGRKWYLQVMVRIDKECITSKENGVIGLDYNDGFIELSETDKAGNLIRQEHFDLKFHGTGDKAKSELAETISKIVAEAVKAKKDIVIEDLDFTKKKAETSKAKSDKGKQYNKMIHKFDYSRYTFMLENATQRNGVNLIKVNPAYTSQIGKQKYCKRMKLNVHQAASYVIARRGQGYNDKLVKKTRKTKKAS